MNIANFLRTPFFTAPVTASGLCHYQIMQKKVKVRYKQCCNNWNWYKNNFPSEKEVYINQLQHSRKAVLL